MNNVLFPSLSENSWISSSTILADYLFSNFFLAEYSQSAIYPGYVSSLPYILQLNPNDKIKIKNDTIKTLNTYFSRYFTNVTVEVELVDTVLDPSKQELKIYLEFTDSDNISYTLARALQISNNRITAVKTANN